MGEVSKVGPEVTQNQERTEARTAEGVGAERGKAAAEWLGKRWEGVKGIATKGGRFLKKLGLAALAPDVAVKNVGLGMGEAAVKGGAAAGKFAAESWRLGVVDPAVGMTTATAEAAVNTYKYVSSETKKNVAEAGQMLTDGWNKTAEVTSGIYTAGRERVRGVCEKGRQWREDRAQRLKNAEYKERFQRALESVAEDEDTIKMIQARQEANRKQIEELSNLIAQLEGQKGAGAVA